MSAKPAGAYADERHRSGLRRYRRRMRPYIFGLLAAAFAFLGGLAVVRGVDQWSFAVGAIAGGLITMALWLRDEPPEFIAKWGRGADGERRTASALAPLLTEGWKVRHDVELGYGNADHLLLNPAGAAFLLETKALSGRVTLERGKLTCRFLCGSGIVTRLAL